MGRPYESELAELSETYSWAMAAPVESLAASIQNVAHLPLIAVGSGGSLTSACVAATVHTRVTGQLSRVMTPYEIAASPLSLTQVGILLCSAGGSNPDVLSCYEGLIQREPGMLAAICTRSDTPLAKIASLQDWTRCHEFATPVRKDGFLATNSLLATMTLIVRAYEQALSVSTSLPSTFSDLLSLKLPLKQFLSELEDKMQPLWKRRTLTVIHGLMTQPTAVDIESRFTEAALANVQLADYRNFAHGRHHWLARNADDTAVLMLVAPEDKAIAGRTASLLPKSIPMLNLSIANGFHGMISGVVNSIYIGGFAAKAGEIDPGRPTVPQFGRRLYHLRGIPKKPLRDIAISDCEACAIERKSGFTIPTLYTRNQLDGWRAHYKAFRVTLEKRSFHGVIFDYDGTLCGSAERFDGLRKEVISGIVSLLKEGVLVGIATGRGKSVKAQLRSHIRRAAYRKQIVIGYHNASEIGFLNDDSVPPDQPELHERLVSIDALLRKTVFVSGHTCLESKGRQITVEASSPLVVRELMDRVSDIVRRSGEPGVQIVQSTHSIDVLAPGVSKCSLLTFMKEKLCKSYLNPEILTIGDRGQWPGNDFELLQHRFALSVDQTSQDPATCWNLAPPSKRNVDACLFYLNHFEADSGAFRISGLSEKSR
jgi:hypothetical protein